MAIITVPEFMVPPFPSLLSVGSIPAFGAFTLSASAHKTAAVVVAPYTGTLDWFEYPVGTVSNNPDNGLRSSFQSLTGASPATPDGTQSQYRDITGTFSSNSWAVPPGPMTDDGTDTGVKRSVTRGAAFACVIEYVNFVTGDSIQLRNLVAPTGMALQSIYYLSFTAAWTAVNNRYPIIGLKYSDGAYYQIPYMLPAVAFNTHAFNSSSTPDERAHRFQVPVPRRISGVYLYVDADNAFDLVLYDAGGSTLTTATVPVAVRYSTSPQWWYIPFPTPVEVAANTTYRASVKPTTTSNIVVYSMDVNSNALLGMVGTGTETYVSTRTDAGPWTDVMTQQLFMHLMFDGEENGVAPAAATPVSAFLG